MTGKILIVDDEPSIQLLCRRTLEKEGYAVETAGSGDIALELARHQFFDLIITDMKMPGSLNGCRLIEEIKHLGLRTEVIIMTAYPALDSAIPALRQGAYDYLIKPFDQNFLGVVVARCFAKRALSEELNLEKRLRSELESAYLRLQEMEELKESFIARVNHELRIPLAPAFMALDLISQKIENPESQMLCTMLSSRLNQLKDLIESLLVFSDVRKTTDAGSMKRVSVEQILQTLVDRYRPQLEERNVSVQVDVVSGADFIWVHPEFLETVFRHLLLNAIRFNRKDGKIDIQASRQEKGWEICFSDTGIGIPADKLEKIFDSFYQVAHYMTREVDGLGIGLTIAKRQAEILGGTIEVQSQIGQGSRFTLRLPPAVLIRETEKSKEVTL